MGFSKVPTIWREPTDVIVTLQRYLLWMVMLVLILLASAFVGSNAQVPPTSSGSACPLNFTALNQFPQVADTVKGNDDHRCPALGSGLELVLALYLRATGFFLVPRGTSSACKEAYQTQLRSQGVRFNVFDDCRSSFLLSERGTNVCHEIQTAQDFTNAIVRSDLLTLNASCSGSLVEETDCGTCNYPVTGIQNYLNRNSSGSNVACLEFVSIFTGGIINTGGPLQPGSAKCLFYITDPTSSGRSNNLKFIGVGVGGMLFVCLIGALFCFMRHRRRKAKDLAARKKRRQDLLSATSVPTSSITWFDIDVLNKATRNFNRENMLGTGGFGNVYKGILPDGCVVAVKRFKNCSPAGDRDFVHEVEMISSVRHRHLVGIRGCCMDSSGIQGHQRIIVLDYMPNGSLQQHLFSSERVLDWPTRKKIAIGMARGLKYLHHEALPAIFHRDIKASNILLDTDFNARLADFGLAKFTPDGVSHLTTRAAGTRGYLAPEYVMYGQLTDKSDVYSFGIVILEIVTGRKALSLAKDDPSNALLSDWAWPLVRGGQWQSIIDPRLEGNVGPDEEMERFIVVGLLCSHTQVYTRPSIDQALKILESVGSAVPSIPDRPLPLTSSRTQIDEFFSHESLESQQRSSVTGYSPYYVSPGSKVSSSPSLEAARPLRDPSTRDMESGTHDGREDID